MDYWDTYYSGQTVLTGAPHWHMDPYGDILEEMQGLNTRLSLPARPLASSVVTSRLVSFVGASLIFAHRKGRNLLESIVKAYICIG